jgi:hypothetical protein
MRELVDVAPLFVEIAHKIVWSSVATVDRSGRPRSRILHPYWEWDGKELVGWVATMPTPLKRSHLEHSPYVSCSYWAPSQDVAVAECRADLVVADDVRVRVWNLFKDTPPPLGYDPGGIGVPGWDAPTSPAFAVLRLRPWRLRALPGEVFLKQGSGAAETWVDRTAGPTRNGS